MEEPIRDGFIRPGERLDDLQTEGLRILQHPGRYLFGRDAVELANFAKARRGERVLDMGAGSGVIPLLMSAASKAARFTGLELNPDMADMARRSVGFNNLEERIAIDCGDIVNAPDLYGSGAFHVVTANPPYLRSGQRSPNPAVAMARHESSRTLADWFNAAAAVLAPRGRLYIAHSPDRLADLFGLARACGLEPKRLWLPAARTDKPPAFALMEAVAGGKPGLRVRIG